MTYEVQRIIAGAVDFSAVTRENACLIPIDQTRDIVDLRLIWHTHPSIHPLTNSFLLTGCRDPRLYINQYDVTQVFAAELRALLSALPEETIRKGYTEGATAYLRLMHTLGTHDTEIKDDAAFLEAYVAEGNWSAKLSTLANPKAGWSGNLHLASYLYRFIPIPPVSLARVWAAYAQQNGQSAITLAALGSVRVTFSHGPAPSFATFERTDIPTGRVVFQLEGYFTNPLESPIRDILFRLKRLNQDLESMRVTYLQPLTEQMSHVDADFRSGQAALQKALDQLTATVTQIAS